MKLYNTASRKVEELKPAKDDPLKFYSCGPTVYDKPTIGNWASFIRYDILSRAFNSSGYETKWIMNITDVGHLVSDADEGEDKLERGARRESKTAWEVADYYSKYFIDGLDYFNISIPRKNIVKATDCVSDQIDMIRTLETKGHTYQTTDGVYFDSTTFADYGKMAKINIKGLKSGARINAGAKKHPTDFALWKFSPKGGKRDMEWDSPWGKGFPGWHIECSAIILKNLGQTIDIHAGGIEHIPIHHTNEIAQSESANGKKLADIWVHNNHLKINGEKISKSLKNGYTLEDLTAKGFTGADFRMFVLQSNFRSESNFTWEILKEARQKRLDLQGAADLRFQPQAAQDQKGNLSDVRKDILAAFDDNLNTPLAVSLLYAFGSKLADGLIYENDEFVSFLGWLDGLLGFGLMDSADISSEQKRLITLRNEHRGRQDWAKADEIRVELNKQNIGLKDKGADSIWFRTA